MSPRRLSKNDENVKLLNCSVDDILETSGKTGAGVPELLEAVITRVPAPKPEVGGTNFRGLIFDFQEASHRGVSVYMRVMIGSIKKNDALRFFATNAKCAVNELGVFTPEETPIDVLSEGEIGYIVTGIKEPGIARVGDTILSERSSDVGLFGYQNPKHDKSES